MTTEDTQSEIDNLILTRDLREKQLDDLIEMMDQAKNHILAERQLETQKAIIDRSVTFFHDIEERYLWVISRINAINDQLEDLGYKVRG